MASTRTCHHTGSSGRSAHRQGQRALIPRLPWRHRCFSSPQPFATSKHEWRGQPWDQSDLWDPDQKAAHLPFLHRISAAESPSELVYVLSAMTTLSVDAHTANHPPQDTTISHNNNHVTATQHSQSNGPVHAAERAQRAPLLSPLVLATCLQRLAEYRLAEEGLFASHVAQMPEYTAVVCMLQSQLAALCRLQPQAAAAGSCTSQDPANGNQPPAWSHISLRRMADMLWALDTLVAPVPANEPSSTHTHSHALHAQPNQSQLCQPVPAEQNGKTGSHNTASQGNGTGPDTAGNHGSQQAVDSLLPETLEGVGVWASGCGQAGAASQCENADVADLTSLLCAYGSFISRVRGTHAGGAKVMPSAALVDPVSSSLAHHIRGGSSDRELQTSDLADIATALADLQHRSGSVAQLVEAVAHEVYRQINNRNSLNTPFTPEDLIKLLRAYATLGVHDAVVPRMLDAIAGYTVKRIRARNVAAVSKPADIAAMLHAYADLNHVSVAIPELVQWTATQLAQDLASEYSAAATRLAATQTHKPNSIGSKTDNASMVSLLSTSLTPTLVLDLLTAYRRLGHYPGETRVLSLLAPLLPQVQSAPSACLSALLSVLSDLRHDPGHTLVTAITRELCERWDRGQASALQLADAFTAVVALGHTPPDKLVESVCRACLYQDESDDHPTPRHQHRFLPTTPDPTLTCQLLTALTTCDQVTIRRLGMACVALRGHVGRMDLSGWLAVAAAATALGEEGWEMAEEVLPAQAVASMRTALQQTVASWSQSSALGTSDIPTCVHLALTDMGFTREPNATLTVKSTTVSLPGVYRGRMARGISHTQDTDSPLDTAATTRQPDCALAAEAHGTSTVQPASDDTHSCTQLWLVLAPLTASDALLNAPWRATGATSFRNRTLQQLWLHDLRAKTATGGGSVREACSAAVSQVPWLASGRQPASIEEARALIGRDLSCLLGRRDPLCL